MTRKVQRTENESAESPSIPTEGTRRNILEADINPVSRHRRSRGDQLTECSRYHGRVQGTDQLDLDECSVRMQQTIKRNQEQTNCLNYIINKGNKMAPLFEFAMV